MLTDPGPVGEDVVRPARTAAATAARRQQAAARHAHEVAVRVGDLDRVTLAGLLLLLVDEVERRKEARSSADLDET